MNGVLPHDSEKRLSCKEYGVSHSLLLALKFDIRLTFSQVEQSHQSEPAPKHDVFTKQYRKTRPLLTMA